MVRKIMLLGDIGVGKTSLAERLVFDRFDTEYKATIGVEIYSYCLPADEGGSSSLELAIWDIDGDLSDSIFSHIYIKGASGALVIGDATRSSSLESMVGLGRSFLEYMPGRPLIYVINKSDLAGVDEEITPPVILKSSPYPLVITSAKTGTNVSQPFCSLGKKIVERGL